MRFLANENFPGPSVKHLRDVGYDVQYIAEDHSGIPDIAVVEIAVQNDLIILTFDKDYGEIIFRLKIPNPPAVVFFRFKGNYPQQAAQILISCIQEHGELIQKSFTVIDSAGIRSKSY